MIVKPAMTEPKAIQNLSCRKRVFLMENHDEAYHIWRAAAVKQRVLVHIDAHDDIWWLPDAASPNIANFICPALREDLVKEVYWVVPDQTWSDLKGQRSVLRRLKRICKTYPGGAPPIKVEPQRISTHLFGKSFSVCRLSDLPSLHENVLLDIDVDFLCIPRACHHGGAPAALPWCWPHELLGRLNSLPLRADLVTIAYSVEGGYTPLKWKYLGDELALRLDDGRENHEKIRGMELMRQAALAAQQSDLGAAEGKYIEAEEHLRDKAAPSYHLAYLYLSLGRTQEARQCYQRAMDLDSSYRTPYNSGGLWHYSMGNYREADQEYRRTLTLEPEDAYAHYGLGRLAAKGKRWHEAEEWLNKSLELNSQLIDSYRILGKVLTRQGRREEAIAAYEKSLVLALRGHRPLTDYIATEYEGLADPDHFRIHGRLARLYDLQGGGARAISGYRMSIAKGDDGVLPRILLARLYLKQRQFVNSAREAWQALKLIPFDLKDGGLRLLGRLRRGARRRFRLVLGA
jgi:tetratricopeptide (TPR) repeat protein